MYNFYNFLAKLTTFKDNLTFLIDTSSVFQMHQDGKLSLFALSIALLILMFPPVQVHQTHIHTHLLVHLHPQPKHLVRIILSSSPWVTHNIIVFNSLSSSPPLITPSPDTTSTN